MFILHLPSFCFWISLRSSLEHWHLLSLVPCLGIFVHNLGIQSKSRGFPSGSAGKESACQFRRCGRCRFDPWVTKIPWRRAGQPAPVFLLGASYGQRSQASIGLQSWTRLKLLSKHVLFTHVWEMVQVAGGILQDFEKPMDLRFKENWSLFRPFYSRAEVHPQVKNWSSTVLDCFINGY